MTTSRYGKGGFEDRFRVTRVGGKPIRPEARYFVLDYSGADPHALVAIEAYADSVRATNPELATDLINALDDPTSAPAQHQSPDRDAESAAAAFDPKHDSAPTLGEKTDG